MELGAMNLRFEFDDIASYEAKIKILGVGGAGNNAIDRMIEARLEGVDLIAINTDFQVLQHCKAPNKIQIGKSVTRGLGTGGDPELGRKAMEEDKDLVATALEGAQMVFIAAGMGGGTGTGAAPVVAELAKQLGALTVAVVIKPFNFEGAVRMRHAIEGLKNLRKRVDALIVIPNQRLLNILPKGTGAGEAFRRADEVLLNAARGIVEVISRPGIINLDFADVRSVMSEMGDAIIGSGMASGQDRGREAALNAISNPLLEDISIEGAKGILINITGSPDTLSLDDISEAATVILEAAGNEANVKLGAVHDETLKDEIRVTVIAAGLNGEIARERMSASDTGVLNLLGSRRQVMDNHPPYKKIGRTILEPRSSFHGSEESSGKDDLDYLKIPAAIRKQAGR